MTRAEVDLERRRGGSRQRSPPGSSVGDDRASPAAASRLTRRARACSGVADHGRRLRCRRATSASRSRLDRRVERRERRAGAQHAVDRDRRLDAVREHDRDAVAAADAALAERRRRAPRRAVELGVGDRPLAVRSPPCARGRGRPRRARSSARVRALTPGACLRSTKPTIASIEPKFSSVISTSVDLRSRSGSGPPRPARRSRASRSIPSARKVVGVGQLDVGMHVEEVVLDEGAHLLATVAVARSSDSPRSSCVDVRSILTRGSARLGRP